MSSHSDIAFHVFDLLCVFVDLSLHQRLVFLQLGQSLLEESILLSLIGNRLVISVTDKLQFRHQVSHVVRVSGLELVAHLLNLTTIKFDLLLVLFQLFVRTIERCLTEIKTAVN